MDQEEKKSQGGVGGIDFFEWVHAFCSWKIQRREQKVLFTSEVVE
jgi:hypothetical protein